MHFYRPSSVVCRSVTVVSPAKTAEPIKMPLGLRTWVGPRNRVLDGCPNHPQEGAILTGMHIAKYMGTLPWPVQKRISWLRICHLGFGLRMDQESIIRWGAQWSNIANTIEPSMCGGDAAYCQITLTTCCTFKSKQHAIFKWKDAISGFPVFTVRYKHLREVVK